MSRRIIGPPPLPSRRVSRKAVLSFAIGGFLLLLIGVPLAWYVTGRVRDRNAVRRLEAEVRKKGEPVLTASIASALTPEFSKLVLALSPIELYKCTDQEHHALSGSA